MSPAPVNGLKKACNLDFQALLKRNTESEPYSEMHVGDGLNTPFRIKNLEANLLTRKPLLSKNVLRRCRTITHKHVCVCKQMFQQSQVVEVDLTTFKENPVWLQICAYSLLTNDDVGRDPVFLRDYCTPVGDSLL